MKILRETGATQTILYKPSLPYVQKNYTKEKELFQDKSAKPSLKLVKIFLGCDLVKGYITTTVREQKLFLKGLSLILGNGLSGRLAVPIVTLADFSLKENPTEITEQDQLIPSPFKSKQISEEEQCNAKLHLNCILTS